MPVSTSHHNDALHGSIPRSPESQITIQLYKSASQKFCSLSIRAKTYRDGLAGNSHIPTARTCIVVFNAVLCVNANPSDDLTWLKRRIFAKPQSNTVGYKYSDQGSKGSPFLSYQMYHLILGEEDLVELSAKYQSE